MFRVADREKGFRGILRGVHPGFTLVELLIVVAIIAILAAIALPNFVQAQVRSRVSAVEMDMRTIAVGLESYRVDNNVYPMPIPPGLSDADANDVTRKYVVTALTTPLVYLSKYMEDPFIKDESLARDSYQRKLHFALLTFAPDSTYYEMHELQPNPEYNIRVKQSKTWVLASAGPDLKRTFSANAGKLMMEVPFYDPTNGTPSGGEVIRTNMGVREVIVQMAR